MTAKNGKFQQQMLLSCMVCGTGTDGVVKSGYMVSGTGTDGVVTRLHGCMVSGTGTDGVVKPGCMVSGTGTDGVVTPGCMVRGTGTDGVVTRLHGARVDTGDVVSGKGTEGFPESGVTGQGQGWTLATWSVGQALKVSLSLESLVRGKGGHWRRGQWDRH
ncbi:hypothetical protein ACOMHN_057167 [Nucella lapillus]